MATLREDILCRTAFFVSVEQVLVSDICDRSFAEWMLTLHVGCVMTVLPSYNQDKPLGCKVGDRDGDNDNDEDGDKDSDSDTDGEGKKVVTKATMTPAATPISSRNWLYLGCGSMFISHPRTPWMFLLRQFISLSSGFHEHQNLGIPL